MTGKKYTFADITSAYNNNVNIMKLLRDGDKNSPLAIQMSYDLQAGSYIKPMSNPLYCKAKKEVAQVMLEYIKPYVSSGDTILDAGVGEATTLTCILEDLPAEIRVLAFDMSWSRLHYAKMWLREQGFDADFFAATLRSIPLPDNSVDVALTCHSIEPNYGSEDIILKELHRVARKALIMFEPTYELANETARTRMEEMGYCRGLPDIITKNGWNLKKHELVFPYNNNPTAVLVVEKNVDDDVQDKGLVCPLCNQKLTEYEGSLFCKNDSVVFPIIRGIPYLLPESAIIASKYMSESYL